MDRLTDLEKILSAARDLGKNLQDDIDKLRADNEKLQTENQRLQTENYNLKKDNDNLLDEMETLENVVKNLRTANETFGVNLNNLMGQLNKAINDSHEKFMAQINSLMRDEFQKFLSEYMNKVKVDDTATTSSNGKKKINDEKSLAKTTVKSNVTVKDTEILSPAENIAESKSKIIFSGFYAEEAID